MSPCPDHYAAASKPAPPPKPRLRHSKAAARSAPLRRRYPDKARTVACSGAPSPRSGGSGVPSSPSPPHLPRNRQRSLPPCPRQSRRRARRFRANGRPTPEPRARRQRSAARSGCAIRRLKAPPRRSVAPSRAHRGDVLAVAEGDAFENRADQVTLACASRRRHRTRRGRCRPAARHRGTDGRSGHSRPVSISAAS